MAARATACWIALILGPALALAGAPDATAHAAPARTVRGVVVEAGGGGATRKPIAGATVLTERGEIAVTDTDGYFTIEVGPTDRELSVVAGGYVLRVVKLGPRAGVELVRVELVAASGSEIIEVVDKAPAETKPLSYALTVDEIRVIPGAGNDILRAATVLPGVARIPFSFGGLVLRGMSPRDTAVYLDGVEVPIAFHFGGVTSFYPSGMLADLTLTAGNYDASYGRAQGGLVTLATREPRPDRLRMGGSIGLFDSSIQAEGPLGGGGVLVGLRRSYFDRVVAPFVDDEIPLPSYWDFQLRTTFGDPRERGRITPLVFTSIDRVASNEISVTSAFVRAAVPYLKQWGPTALRVVPWVGTNRLSFESTDGGERQEFARPVYLGGVRADVARDFGWGHLHGGTEVSSGYLAQTQLNVETPAGGDTLTGTTTVRWTDLALWGEARWKLDGDRLALKPAVRLELYGLTGEVVVDPRLNIHQRLTDKLTLRQGIGRFHQPPTPGDVDPQDGNPSLRSSYIDQLSLGFDAELPRGVLAAATGFYNYGRRLGVRVRDPDPGAPLPEPNLGGLGPTFELLLEKQLGFAVYRENLGRARSYGVELALKRSVGKWFTLLSYTLSKAERTDDPRLGGGWRPFELDQRHNLQLAVSRMLTRWRLGARLQLVSGNPYSPTVREGNELVQRPWGGNLPTFFSLDLRADRRWRRCWGDLVFFIDIQNVTNRRNVEGRDFDFERQADADIRGLPLIPFLGLEFQPLI